MSMFENQKYAVYKYVLDESGEPTEHMGEIVAFVVADDLWEAVEKAGFDDFNLYNAKRIDEMELDKFQKAIAEERKLLSKLSKELKPMIEERNKKMDQCPNCDIPLVDGKCQQCRFGYEIEDNFIPAMEQEIADRKANGEDTTDLEKILGEMKASL